MEHSFDVEIAKQYGVNAAIVVRHFHFWIKKNKANGKNFHEGRTWTYCSVKALVEIFDYWTPKQVRVVLDGLLRKRVLIKGNYNLTGYDRTSWYAFEDEERFVVTGKSICPKWQMEQPKKANRIDGNGQPIPNTITNKSTDILTNQPLISSEKVLGLDLEIAKGKKFFTTYLPVVFHRLNKRETVTFARMAVFFVEECQAGRLKPSIFYDAIEWAKTAWSSNAINRKGLFVVKVKKETGFKAQKKLLTT
ncbi:MAG: hypothetical protein PHY02_06530 [Phycisphaerae bacterium]|nr:hypothetical protein [Phycisphaerae bacterium]